MSQACSCLLLAYLSKASAQSQIALPSAPLQFDMKKSDFITWTGASGSIDLMYTSFFIYSICILD